MLHVYLIKLKNRSIHDIVNRKYTTHSNNISKKTKQKIICERVNTVIEFSGQTLTLIHYINFLYLLST